MGDLEFHYQKVEEAKQEGIEEGKKQAEEEKASGDSSGIIWLILFVCILIAYLCSNHTITETTDESGTANRPEQTVTQSYSSNKLPPDISDYISNDSTKFYKYYGSDNVTYVRHHYEPNDQISKQGYYKTSTGEYILLTMNFYPQDEQWVCNWRIDYSVNGQKQTLSNGADIVSVAGISSENCVDSLVQALSANGFDGSVSTTDGTEITPSEGRDIIYS